jgi:hypothetical protein
VKGDIPVSNPLHRILDWYRDPERGLYSSTDRTVLGTLAPVRPETTEVNRTVFHADRSDGPAYLDVLAALIDEGRTPATPQEVRAAFRSLNHRFPTPLEAARARSLVASFGLLA